MNRLATIVGMSMLFSAGTAFASSILTQTPQGAYPDNVLNGSNWTEMTAYLTAKHTITSTDDFSNLSQLNDYDAVWVDQEYLDALSVDEIDALTAYVTAGGKLVLVGENDGWTDWNASILAIVGGGFTGGCFSESGTPVSANTLTSGVGSVLPACASQLTTAGSPDLLFTNNFAGVYSVGSGEALVFLDSNWNDDARIDAISNDNDVFAQNIADWIGESTQPQTYSVGGTVTGLDGSVTLQNNATDDLVIDTDGSFTFPTPLEDNAAYEVTVSSQPDGQTCTVGNGEGTISSDDVTNVAVDCVDNPPPPVTQDPVSVPVNSNWALMVMTLALMLLGGLTLRRDR